MIELLRARRSIRKYTNEKISTRIIDIIKESALRSPTSRNYKPCEFIFVDNKKLLKKISLCKKHGSHFCKNSILSVVICANQNKSDLWIEDCSIASILIQMTAQSLGLGSCWIQIRKRMHNSEITSEEYLLQLLDIPEHIKIESIIAMGYPDEYKNWILKDELDYSKIKKNNYDG